MKALSRKHKAIRIASAAMITALVILILIGIRYTRSFDLRMAIAYWALCCGLLMGVMALALLDLRHVFTVYSEERKRVLREIAEGKKDD